MRVRYLTAAATAALAVLAAAPLAQAKVMVITYKGHVVESLDGTGEWGPAGTDTIVGKTYTAKFFVDLGKAGVQHAGDTWYDSLYGSGAANPVTGIITLNGRTLTVGGDTPDAQGSDTRTDYAFLPGCTTDCQTAIYKTGAENQTDYFVGALNYYSGHFLNGSELSLDGGLSGLAHDPKNYTAPPIDITNLIDIYEYVDDYSGGVVVGGGLTFQRTVLHEASIVGKADSVTTGGVPEPASWALMIAGFGLAGASLRARGRAVA